MTKAKGRALQRGTDNHDGRAKEYHLAPSEDVAEPDCAYSTEETA